MKKISIIIPCYNAEDYISMCMDSLVNQTIGIHNLEIILVNDASTDNTLDLLYDWERKFPESILIVNCEENGKQGRARNIGLSYASSQYVGFMDDDDIAEPHMYEKMFEKAVLYDCDLVVCRNQTHTLEQLPTVQMGRLGEDSHFTIRNAYERAAFLDRNLNQAIWNKLYKKTILDENHVFFPEGYIYDDLFFSELVKHYVRTVYILEEYLYHHIKRANASSFDVNNMQNRLGFIDVQLLKVRELRKRGLYDAYKARYEKEFFIDYIAFLHNLIKTYFHIPPHIVNDMKNRTTETFPDYAKNPLVHKLLNGDGGEFNKIVCEGLFQDEIDKVYIERLVKAYTNKGLQCKG